MAYIYDKIVREKNGQVLNITIQQVTPDLIEPVIDHMVDNFIEREPLCCHIGMKSDPVNIESFRKLWRLVLSGGASIVALLDNPGDKPVVIGANATCISRKSDPPFPEFAGEKFQIALSAIMQITEEAKLWETFKVDCILSAFGLSVHRDYNGIGLGAKIVEAREQVCKMFNVPMTETVFTAGVSQHIAKKLGYETVVEHLYKDYEMKESDVYRTLDGKICLMVKQF